MQLFFYYPTNYNAPANISRELFHNIYSIKNKLLFDIALLSNIGDSQKLKLQFPDIDIYSIKSIKKIFRTNSIIHMPISPFIAPNERFTFLSLGLLKKNIIINYHGDIQLETKNKIVNKEVISTLSYLPSYVMIPQLLQRSNQVIVNSYWMNNLVQKKYNINCNVIPNGINETWFKEPNTNHIPNLDPFIFYHGRLSYEKGVDILIRSYALCLKKLNIKTDLLIAGEGPQKKRLYELCKKLGIDNKVKFLGFLMGDELKSYIKKAEALFYPSRYESFSLAILEALSLAQGPVYFSNQAGIKDFINKDRNNLIQFYPELNALYKIMENFFMGNNRNNNLIVEQQKIAKKFSWKNITPFYLETYYEFANI